MSTKLEQQADAWKRLYAVLVELHVPTKIIDAILVLVRLAGETGDEEGHI